jgi:hypothetical protein
MLRNIYNTLLRNARGTAYRGNAVMYVTLIETEWDADYGYAGFIVLRHAVEASSCLALDGVQITASVFTRLRVSSFATYPFPLV